MRRWLHFAVLLLVGCGPSARAPASAASREAILGGAADTTSTAVFLLDLRYSTGSAGICSAVMVSPRVLLTAAHCADPSVGGAPSMTISATNKANDTNLQSSDFTAVTLVQLHPSWNPSNLSANDVAALLLTSAPAGATSLAIDRTAPTVGQSVRLVGYGRDSAGNAQSSGTRRTVTTPITAVGTNDFDYGISGSKGTCVGDSGGPSLVGSGMGEAIIGLHSSGSGACGDGTDMRMDVYAGFADAFITANDPVLCTADGRCKTGCTPADPDCPTGCEANGVCVTGCTPVDPDCPNDCGANGVCALSCPSPDPDCCKADLRCDVSCPTGVTDVDCADCGANGVCSQATCPGSGDPDCLYDGDVCDTPAVCPGGRCEDDPRGFKFCTRSCADDSVCLRGMTCQQGVCRAPPEETNQAVQGGCAAVPVDASWALLALGWLLRRRRLNRA